MIFFSPLVLGFLGFFGGGGFFDSPEMFFNHQIIDCIQRAEGVANLAFYRFLHGQVSNRGYRAGA